MCTRGSPDICTLGPRACGPRASGVYIRQTTRSHGITIKYIPLPWLPGYAGNINTLPWRISPLNQRVFFDLSSLLADIDQFFI